MHAACEVFNVLNLGMRLADLCAYVIRHLIVHFDQIYYYLLNIVAWIILEQQIVKKQGIILLGLFMNMLVNMLDK